MYKRPKRGFPGPRLPMWGGGISPPAAIYQTTEPILDPEAAFDSSGLEFFEYVAKFYLNITDDIAGWAKGHFLLSVIAGFGGQSSHLKLK